MSLIVHNGYECEHPQKSKPQNHKDSIKTESRDSVLLYDITTNIIAKWNTVNHEYFIVKLFFYSLTCAKIKCKKIYAHY